MVENLLYQVQSGRQQQCSYPFLDSIVSTAAHHQQPTSGPGNQSLPVANSTLVQQPKVFCGITYVPQITESLSGILKRNIPGLIVAPRPPAKIGSVFTELKQKLALEEKSNVVYKIPCNGCEKCYIGETTQLLKTRAKQHENDVCNRAKNPSKTALVKHVVDTSHNFNFVGKKILKEERIQGKLKIHEINQIILHENETVNFKTDAAHVTPVFYNLIKYNGANVEMNRSSVNPANQTGTE